MAGLLLVMTSLFMVIMGCMTIVIFTALGAPVHEVADGLVHG
jgi:hypothetical protein